MKNKLQYDEQYGYLSYYVDDEPIEDLNEVEINGNKYKVLALDNTEVSYEMGHHDIVNSTRYHIKVPFEKTTVLVDLIQLLDRKTPDWQKSKKVKKRSRVNVVATKFSTEKPKPAVAKKKII
jgi:hypothetical protein